MSRDYTSTDMTHYYCACGEVVDESQESAHVCPAGQTDELEWLQLAADHDATWASGRAVPCAVPHVDKPHALSACADLPLRGMPVDDVKHGPRMSTARVIKAAPCVIRSNAPHPDSYRADLPLRGCGLGGAKAVVKWTFTQKERAQLARRPLVTIADVYYQADRNTMGRCAACDKGSCKGIHRRVDRVPIAVVTASVAPVVVEQTKRTKAAPSSPQTSSTKLPQSDRDALRRGFIAILKQKAQLSDDQTVWTVRDDRTKATRPAPWSPIAFAVFPDPCDFQRAAQSWQSPKNSRTLATH